MLAVLGVRTAVDGYVPAVDADDRSESGRGAAIPAAILMSVLCAGSLGLRLLLTRPNAKPLPAPAAAPGPGPAE